MRSFIFLLSLTPPFVVSTGKVLAYRFVWLSTYFSTQWLRSADLGSDRSNRRTHLARYCLRDGLFARVSRSITGCVGMIPAESEHSLRQDTRSCASGTLLRVDNREWMLNHCKALSTAKSSFRAAESSTSSFDFTRKSLAPR